MILFRGLVAGLLVLAATHAAAEICKYYDPQGKKHYSNVPPENGWVLEAGSCTKLDDFEDGKLSARDLQRITTFSQVKIGMTEDAVMKIGQVGNHCTDWPHQGVPTCGILHYYQDRRVVETASGTTTYYTYEGREIVYRNGVVVLIRR